MAWLASLPLWRRIYQNGQQQYAHFRIRRWRFVNMYMIFRNWGPSTNRHQAHDGVLYDKYRSVRRLIPFENSFFFWWSCRDYVPLVNLIGVFFQIRDDLMNLQSSEVSEFRLCMLLVPVKLISPYQYTSNKGFAEDLSEGKFSFPIVHGIHARKSNRQIMSKLHSILPPPLSQPSSQFNYATSRCPPETPYDTHTQDTYNRLPQEWDEVLWVHFIRVGKPRGSN